MIKMEGLPGIHAWKILSNFLIWLDMLCIDERTGCSHFLGTLPFAAVYWMLSVVMFQTKSVFYGLGTLFKNLFYINWFFVLPALQYSLAVLRCLALYLWCPSRSELSSKKGFPRSLKVATSDLTSFAKGFMNSWQLFMVSYILGISLHEGSLKFCHYSWYLGACYHPAPQGSWILS